MFVPYALLSLLGLALTLPMIAFAAETPTQEPSRPDYYSMPYGPPISKKLADKMVDAAIEEATKRGWLMAVAIVDPSGNLVYFARMDNTAYGSIVVSQNKAKSAAKFKRPTKSFEDELEGDGDLRTLFLEGAVAAEGGLPIIVDGKVIGAIGVQGDYRYNDGIVAKAGLDALKS